MITELSGTIEKNFIHFSTGSIEIREDGYYQDGRKITDEGLVYEIEKIIGALKNE